MQKAENHSTNQSVGNWQSWLSRSINTIFGFVKLRLILYYSLFSLLLILLWQQLFHLPVVLVLYHAGLMFFVHSVVFTALALAYRYGIGRWLIGFFVAVYSFCYLLFYLLLFGSMHFWGDIVTIKILHTYLSDFSGFLHSMPFSYGPLLICIAILILLPFFIIFFLRRFIFSALDELASEIIKHKKIVLTTCIILLLTSPFLLKTKRIIHKGGEPLMVMLFDHMWGVTDNPLFSQGRIRAGFEDVKIRKAYTALKQIGTKKNVIIIIVDALRADHLSAYGYGRNTSPFLSSLIRSGRAAKVSHCESTCSCTLCGVPSILLSRTWNDCAVNGFNIIGLLRDQGYSTYALISGAHQEWYNMAKFYSDDCDMYFDGKQSKHFYFKDDRVLLEGLDKVRQNTDKPSFFYFHLQSTHETGLLLDTYAIYKPYKKSLTTQNMNDEAAINEYDNKVLQADDMLRQLFAALDRKGYLKNSIVAITADHGQGLGEHGVSGHVDWLYEPQVSVPLIICDDSLDLYRNLSFARQVDIAPTILGRLGLQQPSCWMGTSLLDAHIAEYSYHETGKSGLETKQAKYMILYRPDSLHSFTSTRPRQEVYKYIFTAGFKLEELYELSSDPAENNDLTKKNPETLLLLRAQAKLKMLQKFGIN